MAEPATYKKIRSLIWQERISQGTTHCHFLGPPEKKLRTDSYSFAWCTATLFPLLWTINSPQRIKNTAYAKKCFPLPSQDMLAPGDTNKRMRCRCTWEPLPTESWPAGSQIPAPVPPRMSLPANCSLCDLYSWWQLAWQEKESHRESRRDATTSIYEQVLLFYK